MAADSSDSARPTTVRRTLLRRSTDFVTRTTVRTRNARGLGGNTALYLEKIVALRQAPIG
jgi:hypothetical protein